jgi:Fe-S-cluster containining protein
VARHRFLFFFLFGCIQAKKKKAVSSHRTPKAAMNEETTMETSAPSQRVGLATIRMDLQGQHKSFSVPVPQGPSRLLDLLPATREIANQEAQANIDRSRSEGKDISCRAGCGACCRQVVAISAVEAKSLAELVDTMPAERQAVIRQRFADGIRRLEEAGVIDAAEAKGSRYPLVHDQGTIALTLANLGQRYFRLGIACPFLEDESCGIYEHRPAVCRQYHVTSPAADCSRLYEVAIDRLQPTFHVSELLGNLAEKLTGAPQSTLMLIQSLEWSEANGDILEQKAEGEQLFRVLMNDIAALAQPAAG